MQKLFAGLGEHDLFAHPVQKATAHILLQRLDGVADGGLGQVQVPRGLRETARAGQHAKRPICLAVERCAHL